MGFKSTCHWCHVMEHESFEDEEVAAMLNAYFVSVKVDREERPDVDHLYMTVCQALTGHGGWPLTVIMTPDKKPFFAGTYFPKERKYGRAGLMDILDAVRKQWIEAPDKLTDAAESITDEVTLRLSTSRQGDWSKEILRHALDDYKETFDSIYGGFGEAPKFPTAHNLSLLLRLSKVFDDEQALEMAEKTLSYMYRGGLYDHIGFGFARYSTDEQWLVPHFEKMLYDNALLATAYIEAYQYTNKPFYRQVADEILTYILRDMTHPDGGFYSAEDADSEGVEGKFYVWTPEEVNRVLGEEDGTAFCSLYGITQQGNFEGDSIPNLLAHEVKDWAEERGKSLQEVERWIANSKQMLFAHREQRVHPGKDDKILTAWNGLMIAALGQAYKVFGDVRYLLAAENAAAFIERHLVDAEGRLLARFRDGEAKYPGYLDDYACYIYGLLELYEATFKEGYFERAIELCQKMIELFWDEQHGGFFFYAHDSEQLLTRMKESYDGAMPSGNSVAAYMLQRLAHMTGSEQLQRIADQQISAFAGDFKRYPIGYAMFLHALLFAVGPSREIVVAGELEHEQTKLMLNTIRSKFLPQTVVTAHPSGDSGEAMRELMPVLTGKDPVDGQTAVYVCANFSCQRPVTEVQALLELLEAD